MKKIFAFLMIIFSISSCKKDDSNSGDDCISYLEGFWELCDSGDFSKVEYEFLEDGKMNVYTTTWNLDDRTKNEGTYEATCETIDIVIPLLNFTTSYDIYSRHSTGVNFYIDGVSGIRCMERP